MGAWHEDAGGTGTGAGAAYAFGRHQGGADNWGEVEKLTASDPGSHAFFGVSVTVSGDTAIVGADGQGGVAGSLAGAAYVFCLDFDGDAQCDDVDPDDDNDGCLDVKELEPKSQAAAGGGRNPKYFWDFFDTWATGSRTGNIDGFDIGDVVGRFGTVSVPPPTKEEALAEALTPPVDTSSYHASADRDTPDPALNVWNLGPPTGNIDGFDIAGVVVQFGHTCIVLP